MNMYVPDFISMTQQGCLVFGYKSFASFWFFLQAALPAQSLHAHCWSLGRLLPFRSLEFYLTYVQIGLIHLSRHEVHHLCSHFCGPHGFKLPGISHGILQVCTMVVLVNNYTPTSDSTSLLQGRNVSAIGCKQPKDQMVCPNVFQCVGEIIVPKPGVPINVVVLHFAYPSRRKCA